MIPEPAGRVVLIYTLPGVKINDILVQVQKRNEKLTHAKWCVTRGQDEIVRPDEDRVQIGDTDCYVVSRKVFVMQWQKSEFLMVTRIDDGLLGVPTRGIEASFTSGSHVLLSLGIENSAHFIFNPKSMFRNRLTSIYIAPAKSTIDCVREELGIDASPRRVEKRARHLDKLAHELKGFSHVVDFTTPEEVINEVSAIIAENRIKVPAIKPLPQNSASNLMSAAA